MADEQDLPPELAAAMRSCVAAQRALVEVSAACRVAVIAGLVEKSDLASPVLAIFSPIDAVFNVLTEAARKSTNASI